jgi:hypothetical protein
VPLVGDVAYHFSRKALTAFLNDKACCIILYYAFTQGTLMRMIEDLSGIGKKKIYQGKIPKYEEILNNLG